MLKKIITAIILFCCMSGFSQVTKVRGKVSDAKTGEPLPLVNVSFKGTTVGTTTDFDGFFFIETREKVSELAISFLGYEPQSFKVISGAFKEFDVKLRPVVVDLDEVVVRPGVNPAHAILANIDKNRRINDPERFNSHFYKAYTKMELDVNNMDESLKDKKLFKDFQFIFNYLDTSAMTGNVFLPAMISESISENYYRKSPSLKKEYIKASRISGIKNNTSMAQFTGNLHQKINIYDNFINIFETGFVSPIASQGLRYYDYFLVDSAYRDNNFCYKIRFRPKRKQEPTFTGEFWVADSSYAIQHFKIKKAKDINLNWVTDFFSEAEYQQVNDSLWFLKNEKLVAEFNVSINESKETLGFIGRREINYSDVDINMKIPSGVERFAGSVSVGDDVYDKNEDFWNNERPYKLSKREKDIYVMVDSIKEVPMYKTIADVVNTAVYGYYEFDKISIGPYFKTYSFNELEGNRFQLGFRTLKGLSKRFRYDGYLAYGDRDRKLKYGVSVLYQFSKEPRRSLTLSHYRDIQQLGKSPNAFTEGNILSSVLSRNPLNKLNLIKSYEFNYDHEWRIGLSNSLNIRHAKFYSSEFVKFKERKTGEELDKLAVSLIRFNTRWAKDEIVVRGDFDDYSYGSDYPVCNLGVTAGLKDFLGSDYNYFAVDASIDHSFRINPFGKFRYIINAGKLWGEVPYPLLYLHEGNETYAFDPYAFNMMNYYEFASDKYVSIYGEHHFMGFILDRIPLMRKLKWRTVLSGKCLWGDISQKNLCEKCDVGLFFPEGMSEVDGMYAEGGIGVENIFRILRIDAYWRLTHRNHQTVNGIPNFGIRAMLQLTF